MKTTVRFTEPLKINLCYKTPLVFFFLEKPESILSGSLLLE